ncbi:MAG: hypothetical protein L3K02_09675 [Thermoplasmata archaeon]|nr:hypothetical protein [Thermoplasmata archaeon]
MPLVQDPEALPESILRELHQSLATDLIETLELVRHPHGAVLDPASLTTAEELIQSARAVLDRAGPRSRAEWAAEANLAYATMLAAIDLVKSHTDVPTVPRSRAADPA